MPRRRRVSTVAVRNLPPDQSTPYCLQYAVKTGNQFAALLLTAVEECWRGWLKASRQHLISQLRRQRLIALCQRQRHHRDSIGKIFQITLTVECLQRIAGVKLPCPKECLETKTAGVRVGKQRNDKIASSD